MIPRTRKEMKIDELDTAELKEALEMFEGVPAPQEKPSSKKTITAETFMKFLEEELDEILLCFKYYVKEEGDISNIAEAEDRAGNLLKFVQNSKIIVGLKNE